MPESKKESVSHDALKVDKARWAEAQNWEKAYWVAAQKQRAQFGKSIIWGLLAKLGLKPRHRGDDWNHWWFECFDQYSFLPQHVDRAIELGCGPYTNMRLLLPHCRVDKLYLSDPLIKTYIGFQQTFLADLYRSGQVHLDDNPIEECPFVDNYFDLTVMINVLDHVRDAGLCMEKAVQITKKGGLLIIGQDLTNQEDLEHAAGNEGEVGHPIKIQDPWLDGMLVNRFDEVIHKVLPRDAGRAPNYHYGTYIFVGKKRH